MAIEACRVSADGTAALHALLLRGEGAPALLEEVFSPRGRPVSGVSHGDLLDADGEILDDGLLMTLGGSPETYLVTLHGNPHLAEAILDRWVSLGAARREGLLLPWGKGEGIYSEALALLPRAPSIEAVSFLLEQGSAGFSAWVENTAVRTPTLDELIGLIGWGAAGMGVVESARVVLAGVPNCGKSTLFNRLVDEERVVTSPQPGTTRDLIEDTILCGGFPITLVDGAGMRAEASDLELEGIERMSAAIASADLVIHLQPSWEEEGFRLPGEVPSLLQIRSRCDEDRSRIADGQLAVSGLTGEGLDELRLGISQKLYRCEEIPRGSPVPFLPRHLEALKEARHRLENGLDPQGALAELREDS